MVYKIAEGRSAEEMHPRFRQLINDGELSLKKPPHPNSISNWINDERITPILESMLALTAKPFRKLERSGVIDSSKMSQMRTAHSRFIEYGDDERDQAIWMKMHALIGVETSICMAVAFSGSSGAGTADSHFMLPLVDVAQKTFKLRSVLADKAYLSEEIVGGLFDRGIRAVVPVKKRWDFKTKTQYFEPSRNLVQWYDKEQPSFHEVYRFRVKAEGFFSLLKRLADGYCWSRGRPRKDANGRAIPLNNAVEPCTAWKNETLCKLIYINLRITVSLETLTGYQVNYLIDNFLPSIPEDERAFCEIESAPT